MYKINPAAIMRKLLKHKPFRTKMARVLGHPDPENVEVDWESLDNWERYCNEPVLSSSELNNRRGWLPSYYPLILCPKCGSGCCYCGLEPEGYDEISNNV